MFLSIYLTFEYYLLIIGHTVLKSSVTTLFLVIPYLVSYDQYHQLRHNDSLRL